MRREDVARSPRDSPKNVTTRLTAAAIFRQLQAARANERAAQFKERVRRVLRSRWPILQLRRDALPLGTRWPESRRRLCFPARPTNGRVSSPAELFYGCNTGRRVAIVLYRARSRDRPGEPAAHAPVNIYTCAPPPRAAMAIHVRAMEMTDR